MKGGGVKLMQILDLSGMYFDAAVVFVTKSLLLFRLALAILWIRALFICPLWGFSTRLCTISLLYKVQLKIPIRTNHDIQHILP
jgi:hypothetical protein